MIRLVAAHWTPAMTFIFPPSWTKTTSSKIPSVSHRQAEHRGACRQTDGAVMKLFNYDYVLEADGVTCSELQYTPRFVDEKSHRS